LNFFYTAQRYFDLVQERKTLDDRTKMTELERIRHSAAHVLATAILRLWPDAQFAAGPPVENGFYYDVELAHRIAPEDFEKIEAEMKKEIKANHTFEKVVVARDQALQDANEGRLAALNPRGTPSKFKLDIVQNIPEGEPISYFKNGDFLDLCAGPHVMRTGNIGAFKLTHVASAYYKGDERNPQLQRIYGTAFKNKTEMDAYFTMLEEAKPRPSQDRRGDGIVRAGHRIRRAGTAAVAAKGHGDCGRAGKTGERNGIRRRLRARKNAAHRQRKNVSDERASAGALRGVDVSADGTYSRRY
jgi:threonyl-tRNA synthetase